MPDQPADYLSMAWRLEAVNLRSTPPSHPDWPGRDAVARTLLRCADDLDSLTEDTR